MELTRLFAICRKWAWLPLLCTASFGVLAALVSWRLSPVYEATNVILVRPAEAPSQPGYLLTLDEVAKTYAQMITKRPLIVRVIQELHLGTTPEDLQSRVVVVAERDTELLDIKVQDHSPTSAAAVANQLVNDFIAQNEAQAQAQISAAIAVLQTQANDLARQLGSDGRAIAVLTSKPSLSADQLAQLTSLQVRQGANSSTYATMVKNIEDVRSSQLARYEAIGVVQPATVPNRPVRPNIPLNVLLASIVGLITGVGLVAILEHLDNAVNSQADVRRWFDLPVLGTLVMRKARRHAGGDLITIHDPKSPASEAFRELRTNLLFCRLDHPMRTIVVTSAGPGEGKSRTAANLAVTLAQAGHRCILVDADLRRPSVHRIFQRVDQRGLTTMMLENRVIPELVRETEVPHLRFIASGAVPPNPSELLGSPRMLRMVHELLADGDVLVFDTPPLNAVTDAALIAARADATILVVEAGRTTRPMAARAADMIHKVGGKLVGVVLNKVKSGSQLSYYYDYQPAAERSRPLRHFTPVLAAEDQAGKITPVSAGPNVD